MNSTFLIVGIDPGTTTAFAALDLEGNLIKVKSSKEYPLSDIIEDLVAIGRTSVVATDVSPSPSLVSKLSAQLGATTFVPPESLSIEKKRELTREQRQKNWIDNSHEQDALAAALFTYHQFHNKLNGIDAKKFEKGIQKDEIKHLVLQGFSLKKALKEIKGKKKKRTKEEEIEKSEESKKEPVNEEKELSKQEKIVERLERENSSLKKKIGKKDEEIEKLKEKIGKVKRDYRVKLKKDEEIRKRERIIKNLRSTQKDLRNENRKIGNLKELWQKLAEGEIVPVGIFPQQYNGLTWIQGGLKNKDKKKVEWEDIELVFVDKDHERDYEELKENNVLLANEDYLQEEINCVYIKRRDLEKAQEEAKSFSLRELVKEYRKKRV